MGCLRCSLSMHSYEFNVDMFDMNAMECELENLNTKKRALKWWHWGLLPIQTLCPGGALE